MAKTKTTPEPIAVTTICSVCGLGWELHGADPTTDDCIRLLKAELASRPMIVNIPYTQPYPVPYPVPVRPWKPYGPWYSPTYSLYANTSTINQSTADTNLSYETPRTIESTCRPVSA